MKRKLMMGLLVLCILFAALGTSAHRFPICWWAPWMCKTPTPTATVTVAPTLTAMPPTSTPVPSTPTKGRPGDAWCQSLECQSTPRAPVVCMGAHCPQKTKSP